MDEAGDNFDSSVEELDPEPARAGIAAWKRELAIGLVLLLGVLAWGGWEWWHQQSLQVDYRLAQEAAARQDWDAALSHYASADGYRDADARRADAARQVSEREKQYAAAVNFLKNSDGAAALQAIRAVERIEPGYLDARKIGGSAEALVYQDAVQGTIAQRLGGDRPGLYYRGQSDWTWLEGSDESSIVRSFGSAGCAVYDVPGPGWTPEPTPTAPDPSRLYYDWFYRLAGRRLRAFSTGAGKTNVVPLAFDPVDHSQYVCGRSGVWALHFKPNADFRDTRSPYSSYEAAYQSLDSSITRTITMPGADWLVMDLARDGEHVLLADFREPSHETFSRVYLADADGRNARSVYAGAVNLAGARFSPDGNYALLKMTRTVNPDTFERSLVLLDLKTGRPPATLLTLTFPNDAEAPLPNISATFVSEGFYEGDVVTVQSLHGYNVASVFDPRQPENPILSAMFYADLDGTQLVLVDRDGTGEIALVWQNSHREGAPGADSVSILRLVQSDHLIPVRQPLGQSESLATALLVGDYMVYAGWITVEPDAPTDGRMIPRRTYSVHSLPLSRLADTGAQATLIYSNTVDYPAFLNARSPIYFGQAMFAYSDHGQLHARTYDARTDLSLEKATGRFFYDLNAPKLDRLW
jgi:hypothetical protein